MIVRVEERDHTGSTLTLGGSQAVTFCVESDTLWLHDGTAEYSDLAVVWLRRDASSGG